MTKALIIEDGEHAWAVDADSARIALHELGWSIENWGFGLRISHAQGTDPAEAYDELIWSVSLLQDDPVTYSGDELEYEGYADADVMSTDSGAWLLYSGERDWWRVQREEQNEYHIDA